MSGRRAAAVVVIATLITVLYAVATPRSPADAAEMCPPITMDVLFPPTTMPPPVTVPPETTTIPVETTTTAPSTTTTTTLPTTTTTVSPTTTTLPVTTSTTLEEVTTTTAVPETTTTTVPLPPPCDPFVYDMAWPLAASGHIGSPFGADRDGGARKHMGNDIAAPKLTPVLAVADGVVIKVAQEVGTADCCWAIIGHTDGWQSYYIHLNNDRHGTDDGLGLGVRVDLAEGSPVTRGEVIGWVGDSGNAEDTVDHLHFELRDPTGAAVDPRPSLDAARNAAVLLDPEPSWPYADDDGHSAEWLAAMLLSEGVLLDCDGSRVNFCPDAVAAPDFAVVIATHLAGKMPPPVEARRQPLPEALQSGDPSSAEAVLGCEPLNECLQSGLPETELARIAVWIRLDALVATLLTSPPVEGAPVVFLPSAQEADARLRAIGAREACNPPLDDQRLLTRAETMVRLVSWIQGANPEPCPSAPQPTL